MDRLDFYCIIYLEKSYIRVNNIVWKFYSIFFIREFQFVEASFDHKTG